MFRRRNIFPDTFDDAFVGPWWPLSPTHISLRTLLNISKTVLTVVVDKNVRPLTKIVNIVNISPDLFIIRTLNSAVVNFEQ